MLGPNPYVELLFRAYLREKKPSFKLSDPQKTIAKAIIKLSISNGATPPPEELWSRLEEIVELTDADKRLGQIVDHTLLKYKRHDDQLRYFDYLIRLSKNDAKFSTETDRRRKSEDVVHAHDLFDQMIASAKSGRYKIASIDLLDPGLKITDVTKRIVEFAKHLRITAGFVEHYYDDMSDGDPDVYQMKEFRDGYFHLNKRIQTALTSNFKDQFDLDNFLFLTFYLLKGKKEQRAKTLRKVAHLFGCDRGWSDENVNRILGRKTKQRVAQNGVLQRLYESLC